MTENPFTQAAQRIRELEAENERLRGALEKIRDWTYRDAEGPELRAQNERNYRLAKSALEGKSE